MKKKHLKDVRFYVLIAATLLLFISIAKASRTAQVYDLVAADISEHGTPFQAIIAGFVFIAFSALAVNVFFDKPSKNI